MWQAISKFEFALHEASRKEFRAILDEGSTVASAVLQAASDMADTANLTMASAVSMQRASWLLLSRFSLEGSSVDARSPIQWARPICRAD
ncbi:hypothetical protein UY3_00758 [Chelonia mydas]|uniref:Uncharacterized protein n=1 Tax=Chelonia mydas TaxID=8469 RepID=M7CBB3_CHEMY|nr:hypothetical protein UY3_00758 [Chelonia mydas]